MATKGQKFKQWTVEEKYKIIEPIINLEKSSSQVTRETGINNGLIIAWVKKYRENGIDGLKSKKKPGNPLARYSSKKFLTKEEFLDRIDKGDFLEYAEYNGNYYGTPKSSIEEKLKKEFKIEKVLIE